MTDPLNRGQAVDACRIINLDKQEFLEPAAFGDGVSLPEFTSAGGGVLQALAILTDTRCHDYRRTADATSPAEYQPGPGERVMFEGSRYPARAAEIREAVKYRVIGPACAGSWAGDRIATAGKHTPPYKCMTRVQQLHGQYRMVESQLRHWTGGRSAPGTDNPANFDGCNIYTYAGWEFEDISQRVKDQLRPYGVGRTSDAGFEASIKSRLQQRLAENYAVARIAGKGKKARYRLPLYWMTYQDFVTFLGPLHVRREFTAAKAWLRRQDLLPWQKELLKLYATHEGPETSALLELISRYRVEDPAPSLLPSQRYIDAGLALEQAVRDKPVAGTVPIADADQANIADRLGMHGRRRIITLD